MAHEIFGERFVSKRTAAWHSLGLVTETEMTAREALKAINGEIEVSLLPVYTEIQGHQVSLPNQQIVRSPTPDDNEFVLFGMVGPSYQLLSPQTMADIWDEHVGKPIETMGLLRRGALFFCTTKLPTLDVKGDEVERYLGVTSPMDGVRSASAEEWDIRVVCMNTLKAAQASARVQYRVVHDATARERIGRWMNEAYTKAEQNYATVKEAFEVLAGKRVTEPDAKDILVAAYPFPKTPRENAPAEVMARRFELIERERPRILKRREEALGLFQGGGTGMDTKAANGTAWGIFNAVVEAEDYRRAGGDKETEAVRAAESAIFGDRAETKQRGFDAALAFATDKSLHAVQKQSKAHLN